MTSETKGSDVFNSAFTAAFGDRRNMVGRPGADKARRLAAHRRLPMDIPVEEAYLLWHIQRTEYRSSEIGSPTADARPDGNEGTVYTSLLRLQDRKWIASEWGTSENDRKAKFYSTTKSGRKQPARETAGLGADRQSAGRPLRPECQE
jgi:hypothetical protein